MEASSKSESESESEGGSGSGSGRGRREKSEPPGPKNPEEIDARLILTPQKVQVGSEDWRGILALTFTIGTIAIGLLELLLTNATVLFDRLLPMDGLIIAYYFGKKAGVGSGAGSGKRQK
jgi:hypothetical protein